MLATRVYIDSQRKLLLDSASHTRLDSAGDFSQGKASLQTAFCLLGGSGPHLAAMIFAPEFLVVGAQFTGHWALLCWLYKGRVFCMRKLHEI